MTDHFKQAGRALMAGGYLVVPIKKGEKRPAIGGWQKARLSASDLNSYPDHGVGVLCGQGASPVVGVDIDISHPVIGPAVIDWCQRHLGGGCERVGAAPRILLVYRAAAAGWTKGNSLAFYDPADPVKPSGKKNDQQVEVLGYGQQFVAYHQHPDTGRDYEWVDIFGGLEHVGAADLPEITESQVAALLAEVARLVRGTAGVNPVGTAESPMYARAGVDDDLASLTSRVEKPFSETAELVGYLQNEGDDYGMWLQVGAALHHEYEGTEHEDDALELWKTYGARSTKDNPNAYDYKWASFGRHTGEPTTLRWLLKVANLAKREHDYEDNRRRMDKMRSIISEQKDSLKLAGRDVLTQLQELMPDDALVKNEILGAFRTQYKLIAGAPLPVTQARTLLLGQRAATVHAKRPLTEFGNAERMLDKYGEGMMYVPETDDWYLWTGVYWRKSVGVEIEHLAKETVKALHTEHDQHGDDAGEFYQFCAISQQARMVKNMVTLAKSDPRVVVSAYDLDKNIHLLGVRNGAVDLRTGTLLPPNPEHRITITTACEFLPQAKCPLFEKTVLDAFFDDKEMASYLLTGLGYMLMGNPKEDIMFIPFGGGANGKSTILGNVRAALGGYATQAEASSFIKDGPGGANAGGPREDLLRLKGSRMVYVNEPDEGGELREGAVKSMTGGDKIPARGIHAKTSVEMEPTWVVYMPTNHRPIIKGSDNGIWRRMGLIPFERDFRNDPMIKKDEGLRDRIKAEELSGILTLLVKYALKYQREGLRPPKRADEAKDAYRSQMDMLAEWLEDCCVIGPEHSAVFSDLWASWEQFAKNRGILQYVKSSIALGRKLDGRFPSARTNSARLRLGLALKATTPVGDAADDDGF